MDQLRKPVFLIVDDEKSVRDYFVNLGSEMDWKIDTAADSIEAREKFRTGDYSIVFIDIVLSEENGLDLLKKLRNSGGCETLFVMITGKAANKEIHESYSSRGAYTCILKPFNTGKLTKLIEMMLQIDPEEKEPKPSGNKRSIKKIIAYISVMIVTLVAALFFLTYEMYSTGYFKEKKGDFWQKIQVKMKKLEGYLDRDEKREIEKIYR